MRMAVFLFAFFAAQNSLYAQETYSNDDEVVSEYADGQEGDVTHSLVDPDSLETTRYYQSSELTVRQFDKEKWKMIVADVDYNEAAVEETSFDGLSLPWAGPLLKVIAYIVIIGIVLSLLYYVVKSITFSQKIEKTMLQVQDIESHVENIETLEIDRLLEQAMLEKNFKMAVRLYYLRLLKQLNAFGKIGWKKDKTNRDYLSELFSNDFFYQEIRQLTVSYEAVWYGDHNLKGDSFQRLSEQFEAVYQDIRSEKTV